VRREGIEKAVRLGVEQAGAARRGEEAGGQQQVIAAMRIWMVVVAGVRAATVEAITSRMTLS